MWYNSTGVCGGAGGGAGATNSSQFRVVGVANSVTRRANLTVMCLFTGFVRDKITNLTLSITVSNPSGYLWKGFMKAG